ncbi:MAG: hypothetical protein MJ016_01065 [Victivallaceae bacterium]|nr:hypothetical protein [Victivallaceae bacterium]
MPIFRFYCEKCDRAFELLLPRFDAPARCPQCQNADLRRENTAFAAMTGKSGRCAASGNCPHESSGCSCGCGCGSHHHH